MKSLKIAIFLTLILSCGMPAQAANFQFGEDYTLLKDATSTGDLYAFGGNTTIAGNVFGDLVSAGYNVFLGGDTISDDALIFGDSVHVLSSIKRSLRSVSREIFVSSSIGKDTALASWNVTLLPKTVIGGDLLVASGNLDMQGKILGDMQVASGDVYINGEVEGDAKIFANHIVIGPHGIIKGNLLYSASDPASIEKGGQVIGATTFTQINTRTRAEQFLPTLWGTLVIIKFAIFLLSALVAHGILRKVSTRFVVVSITEFWKSLLRGFLLVLAVPVAATVATLTFIAIPFSLFALILFGIGLLLSLVYAPIVIGSLIFRFFHMQEGIVVSWKTILLGVIFATLLDYIPYVGTALWYGFVLLALGGIYEVLADKFMEVR